MPAIPSLNRLKVMLYNITRQYRNIRVIGNIRERIPNKKTLNRKTFIDSYSKFKTKIIKNQT